MKKTLILTAILILVSALTWACAPKPPPAPVPTPAAAPAPAPAPTQAAKRIEWDLQHSVTTENPLYQHAENIARSIEKASEGRLVIKVYQTGSIWPANEEYDGLRKGALEAACTNPNLAANLVLSGPLFSVSVGGLTPVQQYIWYERGGGLELAKRVHESLNIEFVGLTCEQTSEAWCQSKVPLTSLKDLQSLKMRSVGECGVILQRMGVPIVSMPGGEVYEAVQRGVIDVLERDSLLGNFKQGYHEVAPYVYLSPLRAPTNPAMLLVNRDVWLALPPDLQEIVIKVSRAEIMREYSRQLLLEGEAKQNMLNKGAKFAPIPADIDEELVKVANKYYTEQSAKDSLYSEVYKSIQNTKVLCEGQGIR